MTKNKNTNTDISAVIDTINNLFLKSGGTPVTISLATGDTITVALVPDEDSPEQFEDTKHGILAYAKVKVTGEDPARFLSGPTALFLKKLINYDSEKESWRKSIDDCHRFADSHKNLNPDFDNIGDMVYYQDWHQELFGYRPNGWEFNPGQKSEK